MQHTRVTEVPSRRTMERLTGGLMIAYMIAVATQVATRTASTNAGEFLTQSLQTISAKHQLFLASMSASLVSSILLIALAAGLYSVFRAQHTFLALAACFIFLAAALTWLTSAASGLALVALAQEFVYTSSAQAGATAGSAQTIELIRESTGRVGFTLAGLGTLALGGLLAWKAALPRWLGWLGVVVGILMLFIWNDSAAVLHRLGGSGYLLWLLITGGWLLARGAHPDAEVILE